MSTRIVTNTERNSASKSSFEIGFNSQKVNFDFEKTEEFRHDTQNFNSLTVNGVFGEIQLSSTDQDEITVVSTLGANTEKHLELIKTKELVTDSKLSYELISEVKDNAAKVGISYVIKVPHNMVVYLENNFGVVTARDFKGDLRIKTSFANVAVENLEGDFVGDTSFCNVDLNNIEGALRLESNFDVLKINLPADELGYDLEFEGVKESRKIKLPFKSSESIGEIRGRSGLNDQINIDFNFSNILMGLIE